MANISTKKELRVAGKIPPQVNRYYLKVAKTYKICGVALLLVLVLFLIFVTMFFSDYVTYENMRYLAKDFGAMMLSEDVGFTNIVYNGVDNMKFVSFKNGLAAVSSDKYLYFDATGIRLIEEDSGCTDPILVPAEKYLLLYDLGGTSYSVYNQLTRIISRESDNKIITGDMSDSGAYILVTRSRETKYVVEVYNSAFNHSMSIYKENYVLDAAISPDGTHIIICSAAPSDTDFDCEVSVCLAGVSENLTTLTYPHTMPLDVYASNEGFVMLCDTALYFFDYNGNLQSTVSMAGTSLRYADTNDNASVLVGSVNALGMENRVIVTDSSGEILLDTVINNRITGVEASENLEEALAYVQVPDGIVQITPDGAENLYTPDGSDVIEVVPVTNGAIICTKTGAYMAFTE